MGNSWVVFGYVVTYGGIAAYVIWMMLRLRALRGSDKRRG